MANEDVKVLTEESGVVSKKVIQDDDQEYDTFDDFPLVGKTGVYYFDKLKGIKYYWNGTIYLPIVSMKLILKSPDNTEWNIQVDNDGGLTAVES